MASMGTYTDPKYSPVDIIPRRLRKGILGRKKKLRWNRKRGRASKHSKEGKLNGIEKGQNLEARAAFRSDEGRKKTAATRSAKKHQAATPEQEGT